MSSLGGEGWQSVLSWGNGMCKGPVAEENLPCLGAWEDARVAGTPREMGTHAAQ